MKAVKLLVTVTLVEDDDTFDQEDLVGSLIAAVDGYVHCYNSIEVTKLSEDQTEDIDFIAARMVEDEVSFTIKDPLPPEGTPEWEEAIQKAVDANIPKGRLMRQNSVDGQTLTMLLAPDSPDNC